MSLASDGIVGLALRTHGLLRRKFEPVESIRRRHSWDPGIDMDYRTRRYSVTGFDDPGIVGGHGVHVRPSFDLGGNPGPPYTLEVEHGPWGDGSLAYPSYGEHELDRLRYGRLRDYEQELMDMEELDEEERLRRWNMRVRWEMLEDEDRMRRWELMEERDRMELGIHQYPHWHDHFYSHWRGRDSLGRHGEYDLGGAYVGSASGDLHSLHRYHPDRLSLNSHHHSRFSPHYHRHRALLSSPITGGGSAMSERVRLALLRDRADLESLPNDERMRAVEDAEFLTKYSREGRMYGGLGGRPMVSRQRSRSVPGLGRRRVY